MAKVPILAIGGLNAMRAAEVMAAGPVGIAVMGGIMRAADPGLGREWRRVVRDVLTTSMADGAYLAGIIAVLLGGVLVFFFFPRLDDERSLLASYHEQDQ